MTQLLLLLLVLIVVLLITIIIIIIMKLSELGNQLTTLKTQLNTARAEILDAINSSDPEVPAAIETKLNDLKTAAQEIADIIPDAPI